MSDDVTICQVATCIRPSDGWFVCGTCAEIDALLLDLVGVVETALWSEASAVARLGDRSIETVPPVGGVL